MDEKEILASARKFEEKKDFNSAGKLYEKLKKWDYAIDAYSNDIAFINKIPEMYMKMGLNRKSAYTKAAGVAAYKFDKPLLAAELLKKGNNKGMAKFLYKQTAKFYEDKQDWGTAGKCHEEAEEPEEAGECYEKDGSDRALSKATSLYRKIGDMAKSKELFNKRLAMHGGLIGLILSQINFAIAPAVIAGIFIFFMLFSRPETAGISQQLAPPVPNYPIYIVFLVLFILISYFALMKKPDSMLFRTIKLKHKKFK